MVYHHCESQHGRCFEARNTGSGFTVCSGIKTVKKLCFGKKPDRRKDGFGTFFFFPTHVAKSRILNHVLLISTSTGWWFGCHQFGIFPINIGLLIIPIDELIFFRGVAKNHQPEHLVTNPCVENNGKQLRPGSLWKRGRHRWPLFGWTLGLQSEHKSSGSSWEEHLRCGSRKSDVLMVYKPLWKLYVYIYIYDIYIWYIYMIYIYIYDIYIYTHTYTYTCTRECDKT